MNMVEMVFNSIAEAAVTQEEIMLLKERQGDRYLPIWIDESAALFISTKAEGISVLRPLTPDLICNIANAIGFRL